ncbi:MAG: hypothetical protein AAF573_09010 [Bacteroidota bacterium]
MMKNIFIYFMIGAFVFSLSTCQKYDPQFEGAYNEENGPSADAKVVTFVLNGNVCVADARFQDIVVLDDSGDVEVASINHEHTKILFKRANENIQIYDIASMSIDGDVPNSQDAEWFDFHGNNETIYFQTEWVLSTYGPEIFSTTSVDIKDLYDDYVATDILRGISVLRDGGIVFSVQHSADLLSLHHYRNGAEVSSQVYTGSARIHLRLDKDETTLWATAQSQANFSRHNLSTLEIEGGSVGFSFVGPVSSNEGFLVVENFNNTGNEAILLPGLTLARTLSAGQKILSIDY